jgi:hypothetical protein
MRVNFELTNELYAALKRQAELQGRTISDILRQQVVEFIARDGERMGKIMADYEQRGPKKPLPLKENSDD